MSRTPVERNGDDIGSLVVYLESDGWTGVGMSSLVTERR